MAGRERERERESEKERVGERKKHFHCNEIQMSHQIGLLVFQERVNAVVRVMYCWKVRNLLDQGGCGVPERYHGLEKCVKNLHGELVLVLRQSDG